MAISCGKITAAAALLQCCDAPVDRSNHRLVWIENDGTLIKTLDVASSEPLPCNAQTSSATSLGPGYLVVPGLGVDHADPGPYLNGSVTIFDRNNTLLSNIEVSACPGTTVRTWRPLLRMRKCVQPCWNGVARRVRAGVPATDTLRPVRTGCQAPWRRRPGPHAPA